MLARRRVPGRAPASSLVRVERDDSATNSKGHERDAGTPRRCSSAMACAPSTTRARAMLSRGGAPCSEVPKQDCDAAEMHEGKEVVGFALIAGDDASEAQESCKQSLYLPASSVAAKATAILHIVGVPAVHRRDHLDPPLLERDVELGAVVRLVTDEVRTWRHCSSVRSIVQGGSHSEIGVDPRSKPQHPAGVFAAGAHALARSHRRGAAASRPHARGFPRAFGPSTRTKRRSARACCRRPVR